MTVEYLKDIIFDFFLPDHCVLCNKPLMLNRHHDFSNVPLCKNCIQTVENKVLSICCPAIKRCEKCGYPLTSETSLCSRCCEKSWSFSSSVSIYLYNDVIKDLIKAYKFNNRKSLSGYFAYKIFDLYILNYCGYTIVPVPFRPSSKRKRGWDQVGIICRLLKNKYKLPVSFCLKRMNGPAQKTMNFTQRFNNLKDKITLAAQNPPQKVLLIDDVFTTGATMDSCADILRKAGCEEISCLALALDL